MRYLPGIVFYGTLIALLGLFWYGVWLLVSSTFGPSVWAGAARITTEVAQALKDPVALALAVAALLLLTLYRQVRRP